MKASKKIHQGSLWIEHHRVRVDVLFITAIFILIGFIYVVRSQETSIQIPSKIINLQRRLNKIQLKDPLNSPCPAGTKDLGITTEAYVDGEKFSTRLCNVYGFKVSVLVASNYRDLINASRTAAKAKGNKRIEIVYGPTSSGFRTMEQQIGTYRRNCNASKTQASLPPFPKAPGKTTKCIGASAPGYSNHQGGMAIDASCKGDKTVIGSARASCYIWLKENGKKFGLLDQCTGWNNKKGCEFWHISPTGD